MTKKEIKKIAYLFAANTLYHLGGTADFCLAVTEEEDAQIWGEVRSIADKMLSKYPDGHESRSVGSLSEMVKFVTNPQPRR